MAAIHTRLADIEQRLAALEAPAATRQPQAQARLPARPRSAARAATADTIPRPMADTADTTTLDYDQARYVLGKLCPRGHEYQQTGQTLRRRHNQSCVTCATEQQRARRQAQREGRG
jgi:hypothetical protein